jgi:transcription antitermination protein NusB
VAARSKARKRALDVLFEAELRGLPVLGLLTERMSLGEQPTPEYAAEIVRGVASHSDEIDQLIADNAIDWTLERMPAVDRNLLRIGVWELLWADDVPDAVVLSEAVLLAQDLSTDGSAVFVNGLLARVRDVTSTRMAAGPGAAGTSGTATEPGAGGPGATARPRATPGPRLAVRPRVIAEPGDEGEPGPAEPGSGD